MITAITHLPTDELTGAQLRALVVEDLMLLAPSLGTNLVGLLVTGVAVTVAQIGLLLTSERPFFDLNRINPLSGLKRLLSTGAGGARQGALEAGGDRLAGVRLLEWPQRRGVDARPV